MGAPTEGLPQKIRGGMGQRSYVMQDGGNGRRRIRGKGAERDKRFRESLYTGQETKERRQIMEKKA